MADRTMTLTVAHLNALADRLYNRGRSRFSSDHDSQCHDMRIAAAVIRHYAAVIPTIGADYPSGGSAITISAED